MNRRLAGLLVGIGAGIVLVALAVFFLFRRPAAPAAGAPEPRFATEEGAPAEVASWEVRLYFPSDEGLLAPEPRRLVAATAPGEAVARVVSALLLGPEFGGHYPPFPATVKLGTALVTSDGIAWVDLRAEENGEPPSAGSEEEILRVYSVVDSVVENVPEVERVALLWNGAQRPSLGGHVDTGRALAPDRTLFTTPP